jgi:hypothetical protein
MKALSKPRSSSVLAALMVIALTTIGLTVSTSTVANAATCKGAVDIGYLIYPNNTFKGSGSYTSCSNRAIKHVKLQLMQRPTFASKPNLQMEAIDKYPANGGGKDPNILAFSIPDYPCQVYSAIYWTWFVTITAYYADGGVTVKSSNSLNENCFV